MATPEDRKQAEPQEELEHQKDFLQEFEAWLTQPGSIDSLDESLRDAKELSEELEELARPVPAEPLRVALRRRTRS